VINLCTLHRHCAFFVQNVCHNVLVIVVDGAGIVINIDVVDVNKGSNANHMLARKDLVAGKLVVLFLVRLLSTLSYQLKNLQFHEKFYL